MKTISCIFGLLISALTLALSVSLPQKASAQQTQNALNLQIKKPLQLANYQRHQRHYRFNRRFGQARHPRYHRGRNLRSPRVRAYRYPRYSHGRHNYRRYNRLNYGHRYGRGYRYRPWYGSYGYRRGPAFYGPWRPYYSPLYYWGARIYTGNGCYVRYKYRRGYGRVGKRRWCSW